jgi:hypothetical protein
MGFVRFDLDVSTEGKIGLRVNSLKGISASLDGAAIDLGGGTVELKKGMRSFVLEIDFHKRGEEGLKIDVEEMAGSPARFQRK